MIEHEAVNWNIPNDNFTKKYWDLNLRQFCYQDEIPVSNDIKTWVTLTDSEKLLYKRILGGLTLLDTKQGNDGLHLLALRTVDMQKSAVLTFMCAMEEIHAQSYSHIFSTLCTESEQLEIFDWVKANQYLQEKIDTVLTLYYDVGQKCSDDNYFYGLFTSLCLEAFMFYSGFYYPLYLAGQGKLVASGEIISLILRDEILHTEYIGLLCKELLDKCTTDKKVELLKGARQILDEFYDIEKDYTKYLYEGTDLYEDVLRYININVNRVFKCLGEKPIHKEEPVSQIVLNALKATTKNHDFFSTKGNGYIKPTNIEDIDDNSIIKKVRK